MTNSSANPFSELPVAELVKLKSFAINYEYEINGLNISQKPTNFKHEKTCQLSFNKTGLIPQEKVVKAIDFAFQMATEKFHREYRTGGEHNRSPMEVFLHTASGKLGEYAFANFMINRCDGWSVSDPDVGVYERGKWDSGDVVIVDEISGLKIKTSIKTIKHFSNLLLLEFGDYGVSDDGSFFYSPGWRKAVENGRRTVDPYFPDLVALVKLNKSPYTILEKGGLSKKKTPSDEDCDLLKKYKYEYGVVGGATQADLLYMEANGFFVKKHSVLSGKTDTDFDADNFYIQDGNLRRIELLLESARLVHH